MTRAAVARVTILVALVVTFYFFGRPLWDPVLLKLSGQNTIGDALSEYGDAARLRMKPHFMAAGLRYPPSRVIFAAFKEEKLFEVWAKNDGPWRLMHSYPILVASGKPGPKLEAGDLQVPEGIYKVTALHPNSAFHLALKVDYPNKFDRAMAKRDGRTELGGDIFIHGSAVSIGCVALGDPAIEEIFVLTADVKRKNVEVVITPFDLRSDSLSTLPAGRDWFAELYSDLKVRLDQLKAE